ncbi:PHP domain-containing protein [Kribbella sp. NPDC056345]|uniref:PHP domain-containing protein n=1 Tax=Kribbella sp. NPDC056345 TaxID=3345789 RepID=UPI0035D78D58
MKIHADLHTHTTVTDGRATPRAVIDSAVASGLSALIITDHSMVTWNGLADYAAGRGLEMPFPGTEISTVHEGRRHHLLLYGHGLCDLDPATSEWLLTPIRRKNQIIELCRRKLIQRGFQLPDLETICRQDLPGHVPTPEKVLASKTAVALHLADSAQMPFDDAYALVRSVDDEIGRRQDPSMASAIYLPTLDVLALAARSGTATVLAHPLWRCATEEQIGTLIDDLEIFTAHGLDGVESRSYHHRHLDDHPRLLAARTRLGLLRGGGSDYHANGRTSIGADGLTCEEFEALSGIVASRRMERDGAQAN